MIRSKLFDLDDTPEEETREERSGAIIEMFIDIHCERVKSIKALTGHLPVEDEIIFMWTVKSFNAFTFIPFIIKESGPISELVLATYSINRRIINALVRLIDLEKILKVDILISDSIKTRLTGVNDHLVALVENKKQITVRYGWNHAKIALIRSGNNHFIAEGSGNWGENAQHEQYVFLNSRKVYEFRRNEILAIGINS